MCMEYNFFKAAYLDPYPLSGRKVPMLLMIMLTTGTDEAVVEISILYVICVIRYFHLYHYCPFPIEEHQE